MQAIILAGGLGTRLSGVVPDVPKPMAPINGRPFLEFQMDYWLTQGITGFILSVGHKHGIVTEHFGTHYRGAEVAYVIEEVPLGTGGGLLLAMERMKKGCEPTVILNGDTYFAVGMAELLAQHQSKNAEMTMALRTVIDNSRYGSVSMTDDARITDFKAQSSEQCMINGGVYLANRSVLESLGWEAGQKVSLEEELFPAMLAKQKRIYGHVAHGVFIDIGVPEDYFRAASIIGGGNS